MKSSRRRPTRLVPKVVYQTAFVGVIPLCVACSSSSGASTGNPDSGEDTGFYNGAVGCAGFSCGGSVAAIGFDSGQEATASDSASSDGSGPSQIDSGDASQDAHTILAVACAGFACGGTDAGSSG
jgi:hypothetical protein